MIYPSAWYHDMTRDTGHVLCLARGMVHVARDIVSTYYLRLFGFPCLAGVSECIIMGIPMSIGTGMFKLLHKYPFTCLMFWRFCRSSHTSSDLYINSHEYSGVNVCLLHQETFIALWKKKAWLSALLYFLVLIENRSFDLSLILNDNNKNTYRALCPPIVQSAVQQWLNYKIQKLLAVIMKLTELV